MAEDKTKDKTGLSPTYSGLIEQLSIQREEDKTKDKTGLPPTYLGLIEQLSIQREEDKAEKLKLKEQLEDLNKIERKLNGFENRVDKKIDSSRTSVIEFLALFVALFTFVSIEFQVFHSFKSWRAAASLSFILLGSLLLFVIVIHLMLHQDRKKHSPLFSTIILLLPVGLLGLGTFLFSRSDIEARPLSEEERSLTNQINSFSNRLNDFNEREKDLENKIDNLFIRNVYLK
ncbi:MAG: hypothetical protein KW806_02145 [Candidatus Yanofskybacteria bacterium]|nr:hypothetical protein [Candidatus Yanofskybacteria bacterium]